MSSSPNSHQIEKIFDRLRQLTHLEVQQHWQITSQELSFPLTSQEWETVSCNEKGYIVWQGGRQVRWLKQSFLIPEHLQDYPLQGLTLRLVLTWWAEDAQIFVNETLVQEGDLFDSSARILLTKSAQPGEVIKVAIRLVSPGHDIGALMGSQLVYEAWHNSQEQENITNCIDPGLVADELTGLYKHLAKFEPEKKSDFVKALAIIDWEMVANREKFERSLLTLRQTLLPLALQLKQRCIHLLGHAHLDMAWLWPVRETWEVAQRTFESVLSLQQDFPNLTFCHTSPALYAWIEKHRPSLFKSIQEAVKQGSWEILGGMWVEPEVNLVSGESLVRQLLYGQRYIQEKFGKFTSVAWLPDSFGFCWQLPQILKQSGIQYFVTQKLHWNDSTPFPYGIFWWESPDGTQILTLMSPPNLTGVMDTNPITMTNYLRRWEEQTGLTDAIWLPGVGDHGGGPSRDMLEVQQRWQQSPLFPRLEFTTATQFLENLTPHPSPSPGEVVENLTPHPSPSPGEGKKIEKGRENCEFPVWKDELYLEFHRGCYTTHGDQKQWNRRCEQLLYQAELWSTLHLLIDPQASSQKLNLENAWKKVLFNQFHDILPGTSIPEVFVDANQDWQDAEQTTRQILEDSLQAIASHISLLSCPHPEGKPIIVFNSLNWERSEVVEISLPPGNWEIYDHQRNLLPSQLSVDNSLLFLASAIPGIGYRLFWLSPVAEERTPQKLIQDQFTLENQYLQVTINPQTGNLWQIYDKLCQRDILDGEGNQLQAFQDQGQYWDAWNIDPNYPQHPLPPCQLKSMQWIDQGEIRSRLRVIRTLGKSEFCQDYILDTHSPLVKITTQVNWQEEHTLVKVAFPFNFTTDFASYEIPCGIIQRPTNPQTTADKAKWEVPALHWADLTTPDLQYGVSLLNNCKYGYDSQPHQLRLTLLRSPRWPDPKADRGIHQFTYAIYPHPGNVQSAKTVHRGYELNAPPIILVDLKEQTETSTVSSKGLVTDIAPSLAPVAPLLTLSPDNLILMAFKESEDNENCFILRCYECSGKGTSATLTSNLNLELSHTVDCLERSIPNLPHTSSADPWKIMSYLIQSP